MSNEMPGVNPEQAEAQERQAELQALFGPMAELAGYQSEQLKGLRSPEGQAALEGECRMYQERIRTILEEAGVEVTVLEAKNGVPVTGAEALIQLIESHDGIASSRARQLSMFDNLRRQAGVIEDGEVTVDVMSAAYVRHPQSYNEVPDEFPPVPFSDFANRERGTLVSTDRNLMRLADVCDMPGDYRVIFGCMSVDRDNPGVVNLKTAEDGPSNIGACTLTIVRKKGSRASKKL